MQRHSQGRFRGGKRVCERQCEGPGVWARGGGPGWDTVGRRQWAQDAEQVARGRTGVLVRKAWLVGSGSRARPGTCSPSAAFCARHRGFQAFESRTLPWPDLDRVEGWVFAREPVQTGRGLLCGGRGLLCQGQSLLCRGAGPVVGGGLLYRGRGLAVPWAGHSSRRSRPSCAAGRPAATATLETVQPCGGYCELLRCFACFAQ